MPDTVQKFHRQNDIILFSYRHQTLQPFLAVFPTLQVGHTVPATRETDQVRQSGLGHHWNNLFITGNQLVMQLGIIEPPIDT
jgi:hypothetical protein